MRVALGDVNGDGIVDVITGAGPGSAPLERIHHGANGQLRRAFTAFDPAVRSGVFLATGDVNGDGYADIVVGSGEGFSPLVRVFDGLTGLQLTSSVGEFAPYGLGFMGGVHVAAGDVNGDGFADVITGAGPGSGPHVRVWIGGPRTSLQELVGFFAYHEGSPRGVFVAAGDVNGDGFAEVITGAGPGGGPHVRVFDVHNGVDLQSFFAYGECFLGGVHVASVDVDDDGYADIITGAGPGAGPHVRVWTSGSGTPLRAMSGFLAYDAGFRDGLFVAAPRPGRMRRV